MLCSVFGMLCKRVQCKPSIVLTRFDTCWHLCPSHESSCRCLRSWQCGSRNTQAVTSSTDPLVDSLQSLLHCSCPNKGITHLLISVLLDKDMINTLGASLSGCCGPLLSRRTSMPVGHLNPSAWLHMSIRLLYMIVIIRWSRRKPSL